MGTSPNKLIEKINTFILLVESYTSNPSIDIRNKLRILSIDITTDIKSAKEINPNSEELYELYKQFSRLENKVYIIDSNTFNNPPNVSQIPIKKSFCNRLTFYVLITITFVITIGIILISSISGGDLL